MTKADQCRLQGGDPARRAAIFNRVGREETRGFAEADEPVWEAVVGHYVTKDQNAVGLAPERDVAGAMPRRLHHGEATDLVPLAESPRDGMGRTGHEWADRLGQPVPRQPLDDEPRVLDRIGVGSATPEGDRQRLANLVT